ncbi:encapsidation protein U35 [Proboscivirus elephantidbeta4]|uniref:Encapsidation protein U35 n=1 Tax=Elephant endotheliotropic herpesvirus 4 TaxID=548914 RepID=A0A0S1TR07_9BETA|nr:encapsidation protein U35 [Elephant endotheliotropic herpesvirus 4]ALM25985.1 encapsidation protein U35 [Elephant endotheliotropic herpesvirus 4]
MAQNEDEEYYKWLESHNGTPDVTFVPMIPTLYDLLLPTLESRLNFINVGQRLETFLKYIYRPQNCSHAGVVRSKVAELNATIAKLLDINGLVDCL